MRSAYLSTALSDSTPGWAAQAIASSASDTEMRTDRIRSSRTKRWMLASTPDPDQTGRLREPPKERVPWPGETFRIADGGGATPPGRPP
jgi:hypothetical protein